MRPVIVYPPTIDWDYLHQRPQQLFKVLSELGYICIFCNPNIHKRHAPGFRHLTENLVLGSSVPFSGAVDWARTTYPHQPVIAYFTYPPHISMLKAVKTDLLIFDAVDEPVEEFADWLPSYREAAQEADIILATARSLKERIYSLTGKEIHLLPNGCDYEHFKTAQIRQLVDIAPLNGSKPVIGYIGAIAPWLDFSLINVMARFLPDYEFAFIGPMLKQNWLAFTSPNMHYLGYVDYPSLPRYLSNFTYCLIPFKLTPMTQGVNPIKLWEYLASGIPILSAPLPEIPREYVTVVSEDMFPGFVFAPSRSDRQARIQFARENSWQHRASTLYDLIIARLATG